MNTIGVALGIGFVAGIIDTVPMIIQKMDKPACWSARIAHHAYKKDCC